jgi:hypothetical protein
MLPILRTISVGGVILAITILGLALIPPGRQHAQFAASDAPARGVLIDRRSHPEWRQFLMQSALRRADELERLRDLPADRPAPATQPNSKFAGLPAARGEDAREDETGSINVAPSATMPIDIGETSSFELPVAPVDERPPIAKAPLVGATPTDTAATEAPPPVTGHTSEPPLSKVSALAPAEQAKLEQPKPVVIIRKRSARKPTAKTPAAAATETPAPPPFNILQAFFASLAGKQIASAEPAAKPVNLRRPRNKPNRTAQVR